MERGFFRVEKKRWFGYCVKKTGKVRKEGREDRKKVSEEECKLNVEMLP